MKRKRVIEDKRKKTRERICQESEKAKRVRNHLKSGYLKTNLTEK